MVLTPTFAARRSKVSKSAEANPPPTVSGMNTCAAVRRTTSTMNARGLAEMFKNTNRQRRTSYRAANSTGHRHREDSESDAFDHSTVIDV
jgi:hypothetical protein